MVDRHCIKFMKLDEYSRLRSSLDFGKKVLTCTNNQFKLCRAFYCNKSPYLTGMQQLETSSRLFRDKDKRYKHNFHVAVSLNRH